MVMVGVAVMGGVGCSKERVVKRAEAQLVAGGFRVEGFRGVAAERFAATACRQGKVERIDVLVCGYRSPRERARGERGLEAWVAMALTGAWAERDLGDDSSDSRFLLMAVADRERTDVEGRLMQKILTVFGQTL